MIKKLLEVETAKQLMTEAMAWSVMKWMREKKTVRHSADQANAALDRQNQLVKDRWPEALRSAYLAEGAQAANGAAAQGAKKERSQPADAAVLSAIKKVKDADDEAYRARMLAEGTFDKAERQLSTSMAREGCRQAIRCWELHEIAIRKAEELISR